MVLSISYTRLIKSLLAYLSLEAPVYFYHISLMKVLITKIILIIPFSNSLKDKRRVVKALKDRIWSKFRASISEIEDHDSIRRAVLGIVYVSKDKHILDSIMNGVIDLIDETYPGILHNYEYTVEHY